MNTQVGLSLTERTRWSDVVALWFVGIFAAMQFAKFSISYDQLSQIYDVDAAAIGSLLSAVGVIGLLLGVVAGVLSCRMGYRQVLIGSLIIGGVLSMLQYFLPSYAIMFSSRILEGISHLGIVVAAPVLMLQVSAQQHHSLIMGLWGTFFSVAFAVAGWLGEAILERNGLPGVCLAHGLLALPMLFYVAFILKNQDERVSTQPISFISLIQATTSVYINPRTSMPGIVFFFHTAMFVALLTFIPRLTEDGSVREALFVLLPLFSIIGAFSSGLLSQYVLRPPILLCVAYLGVLVMTFLTIQLHHWALPFALSASLLLVISGIVQGASFTLIPYLAQGESEQAMSNGAVAQMGNVGSTIGVPIFALAIEIGASYGLLLVVSILCIAGSLMAIRSNRY